MSEQLPSEPKPLPVYRFKDLEIEDMERGYIQIGDCQDYVIFNADEAIALRDWLNKRFPK